MTTLDLRGTVVGETAIAIKAPCLVATDGVSITLSGVQTVDGVVVGNNAERVLVKGQTDQTQNGIYIAGTGTWVYAADFTSNNNVALGTLVLVTSGSVNQGILFEQITTDNPIVIGTSNIVFSALASNTAQAATSTTSLTIGNGAKTLTIQAGKSFAANQYVIIYETSAPSANVMLATVTSYSSTTLVVNVVATSGSGTHADWSIVLNNSQAGAGIAPPIGTGNVTGPGSSTVGHIATFADGTGKVIQDGGVAGIPSASTINASMLLASAVGFGVSMLNGIVKSSVAASALTFAIKTLAGADPSSTDPVWFIFRDQDAEGDVDIIEVTAALSTTIPSGSTLGSLNAVPFTIWLLAINNVGTVELAVINPMSGLPTISPTIYPLGQAIDISTTAYGGGANSAQVPYSSSSRATVAYSILARASYETGSTLATAGTYTAAPSRTRLYIPGSMPLPGAVVQQVRIATGAVQTGTTVVSAWNTDNLPTTAMGDNYAGINTQITPTSSANLLAVEAQGMFAHTSTARFGVILIQDSTVITAEHHANTANLPTLCRASAERLANTLSATIWKVNAGSSNAGTTTFNGTAGSRELGGANNSFMLVREIMA
jgi:hypothetical protein